MGAFMRRLTILLTIIFIAAAISFAQPKPAPDANKPFLSIAEKVAGTRKLPGYFQLYWDAKAGKLWLEIDKWNTDFLYVEALPAALGSNDIGLDRGQIGSTYVVRFERSGPRVLLIAENNSFRASTTNADERKAVKDAFA